MTSNEISKLLGEDKAKNLLEFNNPKIAKERIDFAFI